jgi:hypothetical protein
MLETNDNNRLKLRESNPYSDGSLELYSSGLSELNRSELEWAGEETDRYHTVRITDDLDYISHEYYKGIVDKPEWYWWVIADVNKIEYPLDISELAGQKIIIPDIQLYLLRSESK